MTLIKHLDKRSGITYVYESESYWDKEKKQPRSRRKLIGRLDKETGDIATNYVLPGANSSVSAWAFAHWGGIFFMFVTVGGVNQVYSYDIVNDKYALFLDNTPYRVVGAGVSTCAPLESEIFY